ncbi:MAG: GntR family transcriptional regulator [Xylanivirga thermophila]|jgi:GntR family transcriptional regulator, transcriptional repressor for pyruvate dehydrogenase complex|uniref:FadR/GntR family transcriptional regulator n=1 Tax=Xylanivirga thermophila TaxID=2496273 RepID=UPI0039F5AFFD
MMNIIGICGQATRSYNQIMTLNLEEDTMDVTPINVKRVYQLIVEQLVTMIKEGTLKVGDRLPPERTLAEMFNVSRASIREAFSAMEIIGLIEVRPGEGSYITDLNIGPFINTIAPLFVRNEDMETDLLDFRKLIEAEAVKLAANRQSTNKDKLDISTLKKHLDDMHKALEENDIDLGVKGDIQFHNEIFILTDNIILIKTSECIAYILESSVKFNRSKILKGSSNSNILYHQHSRIYEAIKLGNGDLAAEIMEQHLDFVKQITC